MIKTARQKLLIGLQKQKIKRNLLYLQYITIFFSASLLLSIDGNYFLGFLTFFLLKLDWISHLSTVRECFFCIFYFFLFKGSRTNFFQMDLVFLLLIFLFLLYFIPYIFFAIFTPDFYSIPSSLNFLFLFHTRLARRTIKITIIIAKHLSL